MDSIQVIKEQQEDDSVLMRAAQNPQREEANNYLQLDYSQSRAPLETDRVSEIQDESGLEMVHTSRNDKLLEKRSGDDAFYLQHSQVGAINQMPSQDVVLGLLGEKQAVQDTVRENGLSETPSQYTNQP